MIKRIFIVLLTVTIIFMMVACSNSQDRVGSISVDDNDNTDNSNVVKENVVHSGSIREVVSAGGAGDGNIKSFECVDDVVFLREKIHLS